MYCPVWLDLIEQGTTADRLRHIARLLNDAANTDRDPDRREIIGQMVRTIEQEIEREGHNDPSPAT